MNSVYTVKEISELLKVSQSTIFRWMREGKIKTINIVGSTRITQEELDRLLKGD